MEKVAYSFSSVQVNVPEGIQKEIVAWGKKTIPAEDLYGDDDDEKGLREDSHVTILYGIKSAEPTQAFKLLKGQEPISMSLGPISLFSKDEMPYDVVKIEVVNSPVLHALHKKLRAELPNTWTWDDYNPHVTIAYVKKGKGAAYVGNEAFAGREFEVTGFLFSSKDDRKIYQAAASSAARGAVPDPFLHGFVREITGVGAR